jgi:hypothetical protein
MLTNFNLTSGESLSYKQAMNIRRVFKETSPSLIYKLKGKNLVLVVKPWRNHHYFDKVMKNLKRNKG